jgi:hypothetical protein
MLSVLETFRVLRLSRGGQLRPWLGPALRGMTGSRLKANVCRFSVAEREARWKYCKGCPHMAGCAYGEVMEPDPPAGAHVAGGWADGARPIVVAARFPLPEHAEPGLFIPLRVTFIGERAASHAEAFWSALREAGADPNAGLGADRIPFDVLNPPALEPTERRHTVTLPTEVGDLLDTVDWVRVVLTSPLSVKTDDGSGRRRVTDEPTFGDLFRACQRTLGPLCRLFGEPILESAFADMKAAALAVPTIATAFQAFSQEKNSSRSGGRRDVEGITGEATYGVVPRALVPWLAWGGRLHVGTDRVAGAGGWYAWTSNRG